MIGIGENSAVRAAFIAAAVCFIVYLPALSCGFINWDDQDYILNNTAIRNLDWNLVKWAFTDHSLTWWVPLTHISFAIDYYFWGLNPVGYHLTNTILHACNTGLVVMITHRVATRIAEREDLPFLNNRDMLWLTLPAGLLFAIHPLRVESVAWATERKDVLAGLFFLGSLYCYLCHREHRLSGRRGVTAYAASFVLFAVSLAAKPVTVVLPLLLIVIDRYPYDSPAKGAAVKALCRQAPFLAASFALSLFMVYSAVQGAALAVDLTPLQRIAVSGNALLEYLGMIVWPVGVIPLYIIPSPIPVSFFIKTVLFAALCTFVILAGRRRQWLLAAWFCFLLPFLPVLAFTQNGIQSHAARFTYLPSVFLSVAAVPLAGIIFNKAGQTARKGMVCLLAILLLVYAAGTYRLIGVWKNSATFWSRVIDYQPFDRAFFYRALYHVDTGDFNSAIRDYSTCLDIAVQEGMPEIFNVYAFRGEAFIRAGLFHEAVRDFSRAIAVSPQPLYFYHRAAAFREMGMQREFEGDAIRAGNAAGQMRWFPLPQGPRR